MGAGQSSGSNVEEDKVFYNEREAPIQFSQGLINHLSDTLEDSSPSAERQSTLDAHVRSRIQTELTRLQEEEDIVRREIETALERENLDREKALAVVDDDEVGGSVVSVQVLRNDLEDVQKRVERFQERRQLDGYPELKQKQEELVKCYSLQPTTPLNCWQEVSEFKASVARVEKDFVVSLQ